ncbi:MAG: hypothetical protein IJV68_01800, partial [Clostridia bacterium]|nr:hypothetical protein [Clostridia bacterium]
MIRNYHKRYAAFDSNFLSVTMDKKKGKIAYIGIDSGGRDRDRHATYNLLLPGKAGVFGAFAKKAPSKVEIGENSVLFGNDEGDSANIEFLDKKSFKIDFTGSNKANLLTLDFSIKIAPPTVWSDSVVKKHHKKLKSRNPLCAYKSEYSLPLTVHFPDFGLIKIEASSPDVYCVEELLKSKDYDGLGLGYANYGYHTFMNALHYGSCALTFKSRDDSDVSLKFTVLDEVYPTLPFEAGKEWNGLRRCWMNSFALNREFFDMGDNIVLNGRAHLSVHMKSDLLQVMGEDKEEFKLVRRVFENQILNGFLEGQADDGEVNFTYVKTKKVKTAPMCSFIDSTPGAIIATAGIYNWNPEFAKKLLPYAIKTADFILSIDTDGDGIFEVPFPGEYLDQERELGYRQRNWWDNFAFGHKDIYFNCLCRRALREISELLIKLNRHSQAQKYIEQIKKFDKSFFDTFYNPESGVMAGWVSRDGRMHDYMFTFAVSMGIDEGIIPLDKGKEMMIILLDKMKEQGYGDFRYGIPGNAISVPQPDNIDWPCMSDWGQYENGGLCGMNGFHFLTAMYKFGLTEEADEIFKAILNTFDTSFTH